ncbi:DUF2842 domain-containing protein [Ascidiaceihabitans sp.]|uniref:DUF2842 domain-containing protein n=1 Tax=Ascidiaceihabitans sp. TaxID=1872644 RepID=UPI003297E954
MALSYKARRRWALVVLLVGLPVYIIMCTVVMAWLTGEGDAPLPFLVQLLIYIGLGVVWAVPLRKIFKGVGQGDPDQQG